MVASIVSLFTSFIPGIRMVDGGDLQKLAALEFSTVNGIVAAPNGGSATGATQINATFNEVDTSTASGTDSVVLPPAIPGYEITILNATANAIISYAALANPNNSNKADALYLVGSNSSGVAATIVAGAAAVFSCYTIGQWRKVV